VLEEAKVLAALQAHGATVRTGPLSQVTTGAGRAGRRVARDAAIAATIKNARARFLYD
jgi:hypothetical protein